MDLLGKAFGSEKVIVKQSDYAGPRHSGQLAQQVVYLIVSTLLLILLCIWFRFPLSFAVAAIIALLHDVLITLGFIGATQMEELRVSPYCPVTGLKPALFPTQRKQLSLKKL